MAKYKQNEEEIKTIIHLHVHLEMKSRHERIQASPARQMKNEQNRRCQEDMTLVVGI
jgi:hypothetical protein